MVGPAEGSTPTTRVPEQIRLSTRRVALRLIDQQDYRSLRQLELDPPSPRAGKVTLRYHSKLLHLGIGRRYRNTRVLVLVADRDVRVLSEDGELLAAFTLNPNHTYQTQQRPGQHP